MDQQQEDMWVQTGAQLAAARKMLAALKDISEALYLAEGHGFAAESLIVRRAIKQAERVGLTTGEE